MENKILGVLLGSLIAVILGLVLLTSLSEQNNQVQTLSTVSGDTFVASNTTCVQVTTGCIDSLTSVTNYSTTYGSGNYTLCKTSTGNYDGILFDGGAAVDEVVNGQTINSTYVQSPNCMYVGNSVARTITNLIIIFFVIAIVLVALYYVKESGIFDWF